VLFLLAGNEVFPRRTQNSAVRATPKKTSLGIEPMTYGISVNSMATFHWGAGRLSRGIGHILKN
jgi:hypothetical protein